MTRLRPTGAPRTRSRVLLFIVTSHWSFGEMTIAREFAERAGRDGYACHFFCPANHQESLAKRGFATTALLPAAGKLNALMLSDFASTQRPALVILADFLNYELSGPHYGLTLDMLDVFDCPVGTFDIFDIDLTGTLMDVYGFKARADRLLSLDRMEFRLLPIPIADVADCDGSGRRFGYSLFDNPPWVNREHKSALRRKCGLPEGKKIVFTTSSAWQEHYRSYDEVIRFVTVANEAYNEILRRLPADAIVLLAGPGEVAGHAPSNWRALGPLAPESFADHVQASDLFLSRNLTSTAMARAVLMGLPTVLLYSSVYYKEKTGVCNVRDRAALERLRPAFKDCAYLYPYRMFPVGWFNYLKPLVDQTQYAKSFAHLELFDIDRNAEYISGLLNDDRPTDVHHARIEALRTRLASLPTVHRILERLLQGETVHA